MTQDLRTLAETRLDAALRERHLADPRDAYRARLRALREAHPDSFARASRHYEEVVLPQLARAEHAAEIWVDYGRYLGELLSPGRTVEVDGSGRAHPYSAPVSAGALILYLPEDRGVTAMALASPLQPTAAQQATYDLLVLGRDSLRT